MQRISIIVIHIEAQKAEKKTQENIIRDVTGIYYKIQITWWITKPL